LSHTFIILFDMLKKDKQLFDIVDNTKGLVYLTFLFAGMTPEFLRYLKRDYHPWDKDNMALIETWYADNQDYIIKNHLAAA